MGGSDKKPDLFGDLIQPLFEEYRAEFLAKARKVAKMLGRDGRIVTINDVRAVISPPDDIDPRVMGAVFKTAEWQCVGYTGSSRRVCHGRPVAQFKLLSLNP